MATGLDWSGLNGAPKATIGPLAPCQHCGRPALIRHPDTKVPCHKICAERVLDEQAAEIQPGRDSR
jgi:hypothetical protein